MGIAALLFLAAPGVASAQERLELDVIPDLSAYQAVYRLDRHYGELPRFGLAGQLGAGLARVNGEATPGASGALAAGIEGRRLILGLRSELDAAARRGRHRGRFHVRIGRRDGSGVALDAAAGLDHGAAPQLAAPERGAVRAIAGSGRAKATLFLGGDLDDSSLATTVAAEGGAIRWLEDGGPRQAAFRSLAMGFGLAPDDGEIPAGSVDFVRGRVTHTRIEPGLAAAAAVGGAAAEIRQVDVEAGPDELTLHIDRELLAAIDAHFGWSWLEADLPGAQLADNLFRFGLATDIKWRERGQLRRLGIGFARRPGHTASGDRLLADWSLELASDFETGALALGVRGRLSWLTPLAGGDPAGTLLRYGTQLEAFYKLPLGFQVGAYDAASYEPRGVFDPFSAPRTWNVEAGLMARYAFGPSRRAEPHPVGCIAL